MAIKLIVTDLDGTFYHNDFTYDKKRFYQLYHQMKEQNIQFAVASGNQYYQLISFFDHPEEMSFASENGGYIVSKGKEIFASNISKETCHQIIDIIDGRNDVPVNMVCGTKAAYVKEDFSDELYNILKNYFPKIIRVKNLKEIDDQIIKFSLLTDNGKEDEIEQELKKVVPYDLVVVNSGQNCIDIIVKGNHKGAAVKKLCSLFDITLDEVMAFGDAMNDYEMLKSVGYGFVMKNGREKLKQEIGRVTHHTNQEDGELEIIEEYLANPQVFLENYK